MQACWAVRNGLGIIWAVKISVQLTERAGRTTYWAVQRLMQNLKMSEFIFLFSRLLRMTLDRLQAALVLPQLLLLLLFLVIN